MGCTNLMSWNPDVVLRAFDAVLADDGGLLKPKVAPVRPRLDLPSQLIEKGVLAGYVVQNDNDDSSEQRVVASCGQLADNRAHCSLEIVWVASTRNSWNADCKPASPKACLVCFSRNVKSLAIS